MDTVYACFVVPEVPYIIWTLAFECWNVELLSFRTILTFFIDKVVDLSFLTLITYGMLYQERFSSWTFTFLFQTKKY